MLWAIGLHNKEVIYRNARNKKELLRALLHNTPPVFENNIADLKVIVRIPNTQNKQLIKADKAA